MALEVPRYTVPTVRPEPIPGPVQMPRAPLEAFGGGQGAEAVTKANQGLLGTAEQINQSQFSDALDMAVRDYVGQMSERENTIRAKVRQTKGFNAFSATEQAMGDWDQGQRSMEQEITNPLLRQKVRDHAVAFRDSLFKSAEMHTEQEKSNYNTSVTKNLVENEQTAAQQDLSPQRVDISIARQKAALEDYLSKNGAPPEEIQAQLAAAESRTHRMVIDQMLANGQDKDAKEWYDAYKNSLVGQDAVHAGDATQHGSYLGDATRTVADIFSKQDANDITMDDVHKVTDKMDDAKLAKMVNDLARERIADNKNAQHQKAIQDYEGAARLIDANADPSVKAEQLIAPGIWVSLPAEYKDALTKRNAKIADDSKTWLQWMDAMRDPVKVAGLARADFDAQYWSNLNPEHREKAAQEWSAAGKAVNDKKIAEFKSLYSDREMIVNAAKRAQLGGIDDSDTSETIQGDADKRKALVDFTDRVEQKIAGYFADNKKMPDDAWKKDQIERMAMREKSVKLARSFWFDPSKRLGDLTDDEVKKVDSGFEQIPAHSIDTIRQLANSKFGVKLDPDNSSTDKLRVARAYMASILGKDKLVEAILSGKE